MMEKPGYLSKFLDMFGLKPKRIIVTGGSGFVGSYVMKELGDRGVNIDLKEGKDLFDLDDLNVGDVEAIIHLAVDPIDKEERDDFKMVKHLVDLCSRNNLKLVHASSAAVYKDYDRNTNRETDDLEGLTSYARAKIESEYLLAAYRGKARITVLRFFNIYGEGQNPAYAGVITKFLEALKGGEVTIYGTGEQTRDFVKVEDVAKIVVSAVDDKWNNQIVNVGTGKPTTINDLYQLFIKLSGKYLKKVNVLPRQEIFRSCADNTILRYLWGQPDSDLEEGIKQLIKNKYG